MQGCAAGQRQAHFSSLSGARREQRASLHVVKLGLACASIECSLYCSMSLSTEERAESLPSLLELGAGPLSLVLRKLSRQDLCRLQEVGCDASRRSRC